METDATLPVGEYDDEDLWEEWVSYSTKMHKALASMVKKFLIDFFYSKKKKTNFVFYTKF